MAAKRRTRVHHAADEVTDVEQGAELARLLPSDLARLTQPSLRLAFFRDYTERRCLQYRLTGTVRSASSAGSPSTSWRRASPRSFAEL